MDNYDKTKEYTKYVKPIVSELKKECGLNNIPFLFTAAIKNSESETVYKNEMLLAQTHVSLTDKRIARMLLRMNGFDTKLPESVTAAMKTLAEYLEVNAEPVSALDMQLHDLQLEDLRRIANGTYKVITTVPSLTDIVVKRQLSGNNNSIVIFFDPADCQNVFAGSDNSGRAGIFGTGINHQLAVSAGIDDRIGFVAKLLNNPVNKLKSVEQVCIYQKEKRIAENALRLEES